MAFSSYQDNFSSFLEGLSPAQSGTPGSAALLAGRRATGTVECPGAVRVLCTVPSTQQGKST